MVTTAHFQFGARHLLGRIAKKPHCVKTERQSPDPFAMSESRVGGLARWHRQIADNRCVRVASIFPTKT